jgi:hypothetical protein
MVLGGAAAALTGGLTSMGCGGSSGGGGGAAPTSNPTTKTTTVLASLEKHVGGSQNIGTEPNTRAGGAKDRINTINSPQGVLTGTGLIFTVNGQAVGNEQSPPDPTNTRFRPENYVVNDGDEVEWFDLTGGSTTRVKYTVAV